MFPSRAPAVRRRHSVVPIEHADPPAPRVRLRRALSIDRAHLRYRLRCVYIAGRRVLGTLVVDRLRGVDTTAEMDLETVGMGHPERVRYEPTSWLDVRRALRVIDVQPDDVFLDYGSGKGRVLLAAARYPYARVLGAEISPELCAIAEANLAHDSARRRCDEVEIVAADVTAWPLPDDVTVIFMHNPFRGATFDAAIAQVIASYDRAPRRLTLVYRIPMEQERLMATGRVRLVRVLRGLRPGSSWSDKMGTHVYELLPERPGVRADH